MSVLFSFRNLPHSINLTLFHKCFKKPNLFPQLFCNYCRTYSGDVESSINLKLNDEKENINFLDKILYNDILNHNKQSFIVDSNRENYGISSNINEPIFLKYQNSSTNQEEEIDQQSNCEEDAKVHFPYDIIKNFIVPSNISNNELKGFPESFDNFTPCDNEKFNFSEWKSHNYKFNLQDLEDPKKWLTKNEDKEDINENDMKFGTFDPDIPISSVPCGGCGSFLHCTNPSIPGFMPKEVFIHLSKKQLLSEICQRCHFLKEFDVALGVNVSSNEYPKILGQIKNKRALALLMVDLLDFPCSIWPGILKVIGYRRPVIIVGNKVDLLIQDGPWFLKNLKISLQKCLEDSGILQENILDTVLISAKTGFGVEDLINSLHKTWAYRGDVFLIGCTNVGKSTLFNNLIQSDYCKVKATDLLQRATVSTWPGTTLNLLKFPILRPSGWRLLVRAKRLELEKKQKICMEKLKNYINPRLEQVSLQDYVGRSFQMDKSQNDTFLINEPSNKLNPKGLDPEEPDFVQSKWCYDTPGVVNNDQIINLLTAAEINLTVPKQMLIPRNFHVKPGTSIFIGGLARLDYLTGPEFAWFTVYASKSLPITVSKVEDADFIYKKLLGSNLFCVPSGGKNRLLKWPKLFSKKFEVSGKFRNEAAADVVLSSAGWVSIRISSVYRGYVEAWTPEGRGIYLRKLPIIKTGHKFRGNRIKYTPAFKTITKEIEGYSFWNCPTDDI